MKILNMKCPNCGGTLEIGPDVSNFTCGYCGSEQFVERQGGVVQLKLLIKTIDDIKSDTSRVAEELTLARLRQELESLEQKKITEITEMRDLLILEEEMGLKLYTQNVQTIQFVSVGSVILVLYLSAGNVNASLITGLALYVVLSIVNFKRKPYAIKALSKKGFEELIEAKRSKQYDDEIKKISSVVSETLSNLNRD